MNGRSKTCRCGQLKPLEEFFPYGRWRDGRRPVCRDCREQKGWELKTEFLELRAAEVVASVLDAKVEEVDRKGVQGAYDFTIHHADGLRSALEVTQATDEGMNALFGATRGGEPRIEAPELKTHWMLSLQPTSKKGLGKQVGRLQNEVVSWLQRLEGEGVESFYCGRPGNPSLIETVCERFPLIEQGQTFPMEGSTKVWFNPTMPVVSFDADDVIAVVETEANKKDNMSKLAASAMKERHLFVWVDTWSTGARSAMSVGTLPAQQPELPPEVTHVWAAGGEGGKVKIWRASSEDEWSEVVVRLDSIGVVG